MKETTKGFVRNGLPILCEYFGWSSGCSQHVFIRAGIVFTINSNAQEIYACAVCIT